MSVLSLAYLVILTTFLWHESEDVNKERLFLKFQLIPILPLQVMHDCVVFHFTMFTVLN